MPDPSLGLSRRHFLAAAAGTAGALVLGACGGGDGDDEPAAEPDDATGTGSLQLAAYINLPIHAVGIPTRIPLGVADDEGLLPSADAPRSIEVTILDPDGERVGEPLEVPRHAEGLTRPYYPLRLTPEVAGIYTARAVLKDGEPASEIQFAVNTPDEVSIIQPGTAFPAVATPTAADPKGIDPLCTGDPTCPHHELSVADALAQGRPTVLVVATPGFCKVAACGPVHQVWLDVLPEHPELTPIHVEVYQHPQVNLTDYAPALGEMRLEFEPVLFAIGSDGTVRGRLDTIWDRDELSEVLAELS